MGKVMLINANYCFGCGNCVMACKNEHWNNDWSPISAPEPDTGQNWMRLEHLVRGEIPKVKMSWTPTPCMQCDNAPCMKAATGGAVYKRSDGIVIIDPVKAVGQSQLVASCPYGAIFWNTTLNLPQKCTFCAHLVDNPSLDGGSQSPRCMNACPTDAITFGEDSVLLSAAKSQNYVPSHPEWGTQPRVYYLGLPKRFVAGTLYDSQVNEDVMGATVTLTDTVTGKESVTTTDRFGDFWFEDLEGYRMFSLTFSAPGKLKKTMLAYTDKDKNLGAIALF